MESKESFFFLRGETASNLLGQDLKGGNAVRPVLTTLFSFSSSAYCSPVSHNINFTIRSCPSDSILGNPLVQIMPIGLCNKPYTLLRAAGSNGLRIFHPLCKETTQPFETKHGAVKNRLLHNHHTKSPIANQNVPKQEFSFRNCCQSSKLKRPTLQED